MGRNTGRQAWTGIERRPFAAMILAALGLAMAEPDLTFFATSDPHYGKDDNPKYAARDLVPGSLNRLPGKAYPTSVGGGTVAKPRGVLVPGDMVEFGGSGSLWQKEWADYTKAYGVDGEGELAFPVYESMGNHDGPGITENIRAPFIARNKLRASKPHLNITLMDSSGYNYSWDWDGVHFVNVNLFSGKKQAPGVIVGNHDPFGSLEFLKRDLAAHVGASGRPVFIMQHYAFDGSSLDSIWGTKGWWNPEDAEATYAVLRNYNIIGLLHGHSHGKKIYKWKGIDVFDDGTGMNGESMVFRIKGTRMFALGKVGDEWGQLKLDKAITLGSGPTRVPGPRLAGDRAKLCFLVDGLGVAYDGEGGFAGADIVDPAGRVVRRLPIRGALARWDRADAAGNRVPGGVYLARLRGPGYAKVLKLLLP